MKKKLSLSRLKKLLNTDIEESSSSSILETSSSSTSRIPEDECSEISSEPKPTSTTSMDDEMKDIMKFKRERKLFNRIKSSVDIEEMKKPVRRRIRLDE